jgi:spore maturation protein CgeB
MLLSLTWDIHPAILDDLSAICPARRVLWWGDPPGNSRRWGIVNPGWDRVYIKDPGAAKKLMLSGQNASLLHEAMNPKWHRVIRRQENLSVVIAGNFYAFRQAIISRLMRDGVSLALYGPKPPRWSLPEVTTAWTGRYVAREEKSAVFGAGLACLNTFSLAEANSLNCRTFEIAGAGGLQLIEHRPILEECFEPGKEVLSFHTYDELLELIQRARSHPEDMASIREAGARRAVAHHTYQHRLSKILSELG